VLQTPGSVLLHVALLIGMLVHTQSWFEIMPKTLPMIFIGGRRVAASTITRIGWAAAALASLALFTLAAGWAA
jgi:fumarate reductase subunit C